jgi:hypothetical protein
MTISNHNILGYFVKYHDGNDEKSHPEPVKG